MADATLPKEAFVPRTRIFQQPTLLEPSAEEKEQKAYAGIISWQRQNTPGKSEAEIAKMHAGHLGSPESRSAREAAKLAPAAATASPAPQHAPAGAAPLINVNNDTSAIEKFLAENPGFLDKVLAGQTSKAPNAKDGDSVKCGELVFTFRDDATLENEVQIGRHSLETMSNLFEIAFTPIDKEEKPSAPAPAPAATPAPSPAAPKIEAASGPTVTKTDTPAAPGPLPGPALPGSSPSPALEEWPESEQGESRPAGTAPTPPTQPAPKVPVPAKPQHKGHK